MKRYFSRLPERIQSSWRNGKIHEIRADPHRYKNLRKPLQHLKRVHVGSFVLTFSIDETKKMITIEDYDHHDNVYKKGE